MFTYKLTTQLYNNLLITVRKFNEFRKKPKQFGTFKEKLYTTDIQLLRHINVTEENGTSALAEILGITPSAVSQIIKRLKKTKYITKKHDIDADSRRVQFIITNKGKEALQGFELHMQNLTEYLNIKYVDYSQNDIENFIEMLNIFNSFNYFKEKELE